MGQSLPVKVKKYQDPFQVQPSMWEAYIDKLKMMTEDIEAIKAWESDPDNPVNYGKKIARRPRKMRSGEKPNGGK